MICFDLFRTFYRHSLMSLAISLVAVACTPPQGPVSSSDGTSTTTARTAVGFAQFPDIAVPAGAKMDVERSLVLGNRSDWIGRLAMDTVQGTAANYDFFLREMPKYGWQEITTVRSETSVLSYSRNDRIATIKITKKTLGGSQVDITVSPRGRATSTTSSIPSASPGISSTGPQ